jgi:hypothetical protein
MLRFCQNYPIDRLSGRLAVVARDYHLMGFMSKAGHDFGVKINRTIRAAAMQPELPPPAVSGP